MSFTVGQKVWSFQMGEICKGEIVFSSETFQEARVKLYTKQYPHGVEWRLNFDSMAKTKQEAISIALQRSQTRLRSIGEMLERENKVLKYLTSLIKPKGVRSETGRTRKTRS